MKLIQVLVLSLLSVASLYAAPADHAAKTAARPAAEKETGKTFGTDEAYFGSGRWVDGKYEFIGGDGLFHAAKNSYPAKKDGAFRNAAGDRVEYLKGDALYEVEGRGWFKGRPGAPEVTAAQVAEERAIPKRKLVLGYAIANLKNRINGGGCNSLAGMGGREIGRIETNGKITGRLEPGSVLAMFNYRIDGVNGEKWGPAPEHYSVLESYNPKTGFISILQQNVNGTSGVQRDYHYLPSLQGTIIVRDPGDDCPAHY